MTTWLHDGAHDEASADGRPSWARVARALLVGFALGLVVHVMASLLFAHLAAQGSPGTNGAAVQCKKQGPVRTPAARPQTSVLAS
jgi:hypothetical protein